MIGWNDFKICLLSKNFFLKFQIGKCTLCWWSHLLHMSSQIFLFTTDASTCQHRLKAWVFTSKYLGKKVMTHWREKRHSLELRKKTWNRHLNRLKPGCNGLLVFALNHIGAMKDFNRWRVFALCLKLLQIFSILLPMNCISTINNDSNEFILR
jgi:hypothetical protein